MHYIIEFSPNPQQLIFKPLKYFVTVEGIIRKVKENFKIYKRKIMVYDECGRILNDEDIIENGKSYIVKCESPKQMSLVIK